MRKTSSHTPPLHEPVLTTNRRLRRYQDIRQLIGSPSDPTPLVRLRNVSDNPRFQIYVKLEWFNPFGSIKDRTAQFLLEDVTPRLGDGKGLVEPSSGNTGIALAALATLYGRKLVVTVPEGVPEEKKVILRMLGAEVWSTPDDLCPVEHPKDGAIALAKALAHSRNGDSQYVMPNQYENQANVRAHMETTGPEIWGQTEGLVTHFFAGYGTCGTITGVGKYLKSKDSTITVVAVEPQPGHRIPGMKNLTESQTPAILDRSVIDHEIRVDDGPAYQMTLRLFREEGLIVGPSTGAIVHAAVEYGRDKEGLCVCISPDSGFKYASYFAEFLGDEGKPTGLDRKEEPTASLPQEVSGGTT